MITNVKITVEAGKPIYVMPPVFEYDFGRTAEIYGTGLTEATEVHWSLDDSDGSAEVYMADYDAEKDCLTCPIPDHMLRRDKDGKNYSIWGFIYKEEETEGTTLFRFCIPITARPIPTEEVPSPWDKNSGACVNIKSYGAIGDGETDNSEAFKQALEEHDCIYVPGGTYLVNDTLYLTDGKTITGSGEKSIIRAGDPTKPLFMVEGESLTNHRFITLSNFTLQYKGEDRTVWPVRFYNCSYCTLDHLKIEKIDDIFCETGGVSFSRYPGYRGNSYINKIKNCFFWLGGIDFEASDSYIENNTIWAQQNPWSIRMEKASNTGILYNEIIPGRTCGIWIPNAQTDLQIVGNYFDGSYYSQATGHMIQIDGNLDCALITGNKFWRPKKSAIIGQMSKSVISGNTIDNADFMGAGFTPFDLSGNCYALTITDNTFTAIQWYNSETEVQEQRPASKRVPPLKLTNQEASGYGWTYISGNTATYDDRWANSQISGRVRSFQADRFKYSYPLDASLALDGAVYTEGEGVLRKIYAKGAGEITPVKITYLTRWYSSESPLDMDTVVTVNGTYLINDPTAIQGGPSDYTISNNDIVQVDNLYSGLTFYRLYTPRGIYYKYATAATAGTWHIAGAVSNRIPEYTYITSNWSSASPLDFNAVTAVIGVYLLNDVTAIVNGPAGYTPANGDIIKIEQLYSGLTHYEIYAPGCIWYKNATNGSAGTWSKTAYSAGAGIEITNGIISALPDAITDNGAATSISSRSYDQGLLSLGFSNNTTVSLYDKPYVDSQVTAFSNALSSCFKAEAQTLTDLDAMTGPACQHITDITISNLPANEPGWCETYQQGTAKQQRYYCDSGSVYIRSDSGSGYGAWIKIAEPIT